MVYKELKNEGGYTLVEVLIALAILSIVISMVSVSFIFVSKRMEDWKDQISFYNQFMIISNKINNDLIRANQISYTDTILQVSLNDQKQNRYSWTNGKLKLNNTLMGEASDSTWIKVVEVKKDSLHTISYWITYKSKVRLISDSAIVQIREPIGWSPAKKDGG